MNTQTERVDVLAILDALALQTRQRGGSPSVGNIETARAAVAELIEVTSMARNEISNLNSAYGSERLDILENRLATALARIGGDV